MESEDKPLKINEQQNKDFIWTWKSSSKSSKVSVWVPYFNELSKGKGKSHWFITYNGGILDLDLNKVDFILFYGASGVLPLEFLDQLSAHGIIFIIHRRNMVRPYFFFPSNIGDSQDLLTQQILFRTNKIQRSYIARTLIHNRFASFRPDFSVYDQEIIALNQARDVNKVRSIEAVVSARFWKQWFKELGVDESRRSDNYVSTALDAVSKFFYGIILRWVLFHTLSPCHGYLHIPTDYPSLVYDLIEPYRYILELSVKKAFTNVGNNKDLTATALNEAKSLLEESVYVPATRQFVRRKNLLHGVVLALRAYLTGETKRLVIPTEGMKKGGRPPQCGYSLPGEIYLKR